jgi:UDP-N-acetylglucosamine transferase subunit ALG13
VSLKFYYGFIQLGTGSILHALRANKPTLVICNESLADNHQVELAEALQEQKFLRVLKISALRAFIDLELPKFLTSKRATWTPSKPQRLYALIDEEMGYASVKQKEKKP